MAKTHAFGCNECGATFARWAGRCTACGAMNSIVELNRKEAELLTARGNGGTSSAKALTTEPMSDTSQAPAVRQATNMAELDRVLGGGIVDGSVILLGGEPGIGKSTLLAQVCGALAMQRRVAYITAEEATSQVRDRCQRLGITGDVHLAASSDAGEIAATIASGDYAVVVVDSIQLLVRDGVDGMPGGSAQVRACGSLLAETAKSAGVTLFIIGHVTKDGSLAGPRTLEHLVDVVLLFEGDRYLDLRTLRAVKNRHGSTHELGLFRMVAKGLEEVPDPAGLFISDRATGVSGSCIVPIIDGNRCLLVEVQALVNPSDAPNPQRRLGVSGCDQNRVAMIIAVLSRRLGLPLGSYDVFINATGGASVKEPAGDLAIALAIASSYHDVPIPADCCAIGEVGLGGELRPAPRYELRAAEARRLGFQRLLGPGKGRGKGRIVTPTLGDAIEILETD